MYHRKNEGPRTKPYGIYIRPEIPYDWRRSVCQALSKAFDISSVTVEFQDLFNSLVSLLDKTIKRFAV